MTPRLSLLLLAFAAGPTSAADAMFNVKLLTPETALKAAQAALARCRSSGYQVAVAVTDPIRRSDGSNWPSAERMRHDQHWCRSRAASASALASSNEAHASTRWWQSRSRTAYFGDNGDDQI